MDFFHREVSLLSPNEVVRVALPGKIDIEGLLNGRLIVTLNEDWKPQGGDTSFVQGSVIALDLGAVKKDPVHLKPTAVFAPTAKEFAQRVELTKDHLLLTTLENVQGRAYIYTRDGKSVWTRKKLGVPDNLTVSIVSGNWSNNQFFLALTGFLTPSSLLLGDAAAGVALKQAKALAPQFDASREVVEQLEARSTDDTQVPYFVVRRKDLKYDGANPALLTAYGGFQISTTPQYMPEVGKLWLERGGVLSMPILGAAESLVRLA